jgi:hypothetical protein
MEISTRSISQSLNLYAVFGYLLPGFFLTTLYIVDFDVSLIMRLYSNGQILKFKDVENVENLRLNLLMSYFSSGTMSDFKFIPFIIFIFFCYVLGHIISSFSSLIIERFFIKVIFGYPSAILLNEKNPGWKWFNHFYLFKFILKDFRKPFPKKTRKKIIKTAEETFKYKMPLEDYYWQCYSFIITERPYLAPRVHHFVNLYGFSRNIAASIFIYLFTRLFILNWCIGISMDKFVWIVFSILTLCGILLLWNYTKLFKRQAVDVYTLFLSIDSSKNGYSVENQIV